MRRPEPTDPVNPDLLELSLHSHEVRNRLSTIKSSAELLLGESLPQGTREMIFLILERTWSALDLESSFNLERSLKAGLYRPFRNEHVLGDLVEATVSALKESTGREVILSSGPDLAFRQWIATWNGDEHLLLLVLRNLARLILSECGPDDLRLSVELEDGSLRWLLEPACSIRREVPLGSAFLQARRFATALGGRVARLSHHQGLVLTLHRVPCPAEERSRRETALSAPGR